MSPSPEYYLHLLASPDDFDLKLIERWGEGRLEHSNSTFICNLDIKGKGDSEFPLILRGIIQTHWCFLGSGELVIPTGVVYRTNRARQETPGLARLASENTRYLGEGHLPHVLPILQIDPSASTGEIDISNTAIYYSIEPTNQNVTEIHGIRFERSRENIPNNNNWRVFDARTSQSNIISAMGFVQSLRDQLPHWDITPSFLPA